MFRLEALFLTFFRSKDGLSDSVWLEMQILGSRKKGESQGAPGKQLLITYHQSLRWSHILRNTLPICQKSDNDHQRISLTISEQEQMGVSAVPSNLDRPLREV